MAKAFFDAPLPLKFAHRGATDAGRLDENTWPAFEEALAQGATHIETDAQVTRDGVAVLFHDDDLLRVGATPLSPGRKLVAEYDFSELRAMKLARGGQISSLLETLQRFPEVRFNIDVKVAGAVHPVAEAIRQTNSYERVLITSFSDRRRIATLNLLYQGEAGHRWAATSPGSSTLLKAWLGFWLLSALGHRAMVRGLGLLLRGSDAIQVPQRHGLIWFANPRFISAVRELGTHVHFWVVNDEATAKKLIRLGATGIVTDDLPALRL